MTSWIELTKEVQSVKPEDIPEGGSQYDVVRKKYYKELVALTKRPLVVYATAFHFQPKAVLFGNLMSIDLSDKDGFEEVIDKLKGDKLDILIHSPGGSAEAAESIVKIIRKKFPKDVRFIITGTAKSAATMLAMSGNSILISAAGELGPIDPQVRIDNRFSPAGSIIDQFDKAVKDIRTNPTHFNAWLPMLKQYGPSLLVECENFIKLARDLVKNWLAEYMFSGEPQPKRRAGRISKFLANEKNTLSHARRIDYAKLKELGLRISLLEDEPQNIQDALRTVHLIIMQTLEGTNAIKIHENSQGDAFIRSAQPIALTPNAAQ
jgi:hypothetical protein